jgi:hypothetical protein
MSNAPPGAMSSPYCQGGEMSEMLKKSDYFKDASFNTEQKVENMSDIKKSEFLESGKILNQEKSKEQEIPERDPGIVFQPGIKNEMMKLLMDNKLEINSVSDTKIEFTYNGEKFLILPL